MNTNSPILVTGGAGFIGSTFIRDWLHDPQRGPIINIDALTYAGNLMSLVSIQNDPRYAFVRGDIKDSSLLQTTLQKYQPSAIIHFAAESHVDRSINAPNIFIQTNIEGTFCLLETARAYWNGLTSSTRQQFRFIHISTDEVYGTLGPLDEAFSETTPYSPNSPYAASKAASDHLVHAWHHTYGLPVITTNCSNNYGPYQFPEKLIPLMIINALAGKPLPIYGDGHQVRDWLYVGDHCAAIREVLTNGNVGEKYNIGGCNEQSNINVVRTLCRTLDAFLPAQRPYENLITHVTDRPGHDRRYAINHQKIVAELNWRPTEDFNSGIAKTVRWYLENTQWIADVQNGAYRNYDGK